MRAHLGLSLVGCLLVGVCAGSVHAEQRLVNAQIQALVSGKTAYRRHARKDVSGYAFFDPGGSYLAFRSDKGASRGAWSISDDRFCYQLSGRDSECFEVHDEGNGTYRLYEQPGGPMKPKKHIWTWERIVDGNVENMR